MTTEQYSHRNGEAIPPEEQGYFWYEWEFPIDGTDKSNISRALFKVWAGESEPQQLYCQNWPHANHRSNHPKVELMRGLWWGPIPLVMPWDEVTNGG